MQRIVFASAIAATAFAAVPADQREQLTAVMKTWVDEFGSDASLLPHGASLDNVDDILSRLYATQNTIASLSKQNPDAKFGVGPFSLFSSAEFAEHVGKSFKHGAPKRVLRRENDSVDWESLPSSPAASPVDWTQSKCVNQIKNQGNCGSCWAFSAAGVIESAHCIATGTLLDIAEQQAVSCEVEDGQGGCEGGWPADSIDWMVKTGMCLTKDYPYTSGTTGQNGVCKTSCAKQTFNLDGSVELKGEAGLTTGIQTQPISVAVEAGNDVWQHYKGGVVSKCPGAQSDHAVIAVGIDSENGKDYYKIRNSWGAKWGEAGYIRLQRGVGGKGMCNVGEYPYYPKIKGTPAPTKPAC
ncbi:cysteine protease family C01A [Thraustotheca clavata]|uniref:Cysteine protease family C01A n=1 Tax=Thraustotheca clavata TaxID=74557 RepID=A0A1V9ZKM7_9STRA|nr:cysteine protease family C01A [Thraustotheca clavata]